MNTASFYIIKDEFFQFANEPYLKGNKNQSRPHYYCFEEQDSGIFWMIPLSSRVDKYRRIIEKKEHSGKRCDILHIAKLDNDKESVFLIQDMFPVTAQYIDLQFTLAGNPMILSSQHTVDAIDRKARRVLGMLKRGVKFTPTQPNALAILEKLKEK